MVSDLFRSSGRQRGIAMSMYLLLYSGGGMPETEEETTR